MGIPRPPLRFEHPDHYREHFFRLLELERREEMEAMEREMRSLSGPEREKIGHAVLKLKPTDRGPWIGGRRLYTLWRADPFETEIGPGDMVLVSLRHPLRDGIPGVVLERTRHTFQLVLDQRLPRAWRQVRLDLYVNDITFRRMAQALRNLELGAFDLPVLLGHKAPRIQSLALPVAGSLNASQREAVQKALGSWPLFLIHGPFGTGKTTTLAEVLRLAVDQGLRVLATADSNIAVDNLAEGALARDIPLVRIGHPAKMLPALREQSLDLQVERHPRYGLVRAHWKRIEELRQLQESYPRPTPARRRGLTYEQILRYGRHFKGSRGISREEMRRMARWVELEQQIRALRESAQKETDRIVKDLIGRAAVVFATCSGAGSEYLEQETFDLVVIDEATQATEPATLIPLLKAPRVVLAGDHRQLPPTVLSQEADALGLGFTLFERWITLYPQASELLQVQYRMHPDLMEFSNRRFYGGRLRAAPGLEHLRLSQLLDTPLSDHPVLNDRPLVFVHVSGAPERQRRGSTSRENLGQALWIQTWVDTLLKHGLAPEQVGVIAPYEDQVKLLRGLLPEDVEVKTVDGFQGREKEVIFLSLVRSNPQGEIGFLRDQRRLNVALTRARRKLVLVGDRTTLRQDPLYRDLLRFLEERGAIVEVPPPASLRPASGEGA